MKKYYFLGVVAVGVCLLTGQADARILIKASPEVDSHAEADHDHETEESGTSSLYPTATNILRTAPTYYSIRPTYIPPPAPVYYSARNQSVRNTSLPMKRQKLFQARESFQAPVPDNNGTTGDATEKTTNTQSWLGTPSSASAYEPQMYRSAAPYVYTRTYAPDAYYRTYE